MAASAGLLGLGYKIRSVCGGVRALGSRWIASSSWWWAISPNAGRNALGRIWPPWPRDLVGPCLILQQLLQWSVAAANPSVATLQPVGDQTRHFSGTFAMQEMAAAVDQYPRVRTHKERLLRLQHFTSKVI